MPFNNNYHLWVVVMLNFALIFICNLKVLKSYWLLRLMSVHLIVCLHTDAHLYYDNCCRQECLCVPDQSQNLLILGEVM